MATDTNLRPPEPRTLPREHRTAPPPSADPRSFGDLLSELSSETTTLLKQEVALAKTEIRQEARTAGANVGALAAGGAVAYSGLIVLLVGLGLLLGTFMPDWLGFLLVGAAVALVGYGMAQKGLSALREMDPKPARTVESLKRDKEWLTEETRR